MKTASRSEPLFIYKQIKGQLVLESLDLKVQRLEHKFSLKVGYHRVKAEMLKCSRILNLVLDTVIRSYYLMVKRYLSNKILTLETFFISMVITYHLNK